MKQYTDKELLNIRRLIHSIQKENQYQIDKWGIQTHTLFEWLNYTMEELGELAKAIAEHEYRYGTGNDIYDEAIQTATLCLKIAEMSMTKNGKCKRTDCISYESKTEPFINGYCRGCDYFLRK